MSDTAERKKGSSLLTGLFVSAKFSVESRAPRAIIRWLELCFVGFLFLAFFVLVLIFVFRMEP